MLVGVAASAVAVVVSVYMGSVGVRSVFRVISTYHCGQDGFTWDDNR